MFLLDINKLWCYCGRRITHPCSRGFNEAACNRVEQGNPLTCVPSGAPSVTEPRHGGVRLKLVTLIPALALIAISAAALARRRERNWIWALLLALGVFMTIIWAIQK